VHILTWFLQGDVTRDTVLPLFLNSIAGFVVLLIPLSLFLGVLLAFSRLFIDSEMTAMMAGGIGPRQWYRALLMVNVPVSLLVLVLMLYVKPWISSQRADINTQIRNTDLISLLAPGRFNSTQNGKAIIFMESLSKDGGEMENVFQRHISNGKTHIDVAARADTRKLANGASFAVLKQGTHYSGVPGDADYQVIKYDEYGVLLPEPKDLVYPMQIKALPTRTLLESGTPEHLAELDWRIAIPVATFIITLMTLPLSQTTPRGGRYAKLGLAILLYLIYSNLLGVGMVWIAKGIVPVWMGTTWVHLLALVLLYLLLRKNGFISKRGQKKAVV
jgi:lipopolysaccharide export system permease protein